MDSEADTIICPVLNPQFTPDRRASRAFRTTNSGGQDFVIYRDPVEWPVPRSGSASQEDILEELMNWDEDQENQPPVDHEDEESEG